MPRRRSLIVWIIVCALTALGGWALWVWMFWLGHGTNWFERWWPLMMAIPFSLAALMTVRLVRRTTSSR